MKGGDLLSKYTFKIPMYRKSSKKIEIFDANNRIVGSLKRVYNNVFQKVIDTIFSNDMFINVTSFDEQEKFFCKAQERGWIKSEWEITTKSSKYVLHNKTKIKTNPRMEFELNGNKYLIKKDFADKRVYFETDNKTVATFKYDKIVGSKTIEAEIKSDCIHHLELICLYYVFFLRD